MTSYCVVAVPFVLVGCFWLKCALGHYWPAVKKRVLWILAAASVAALFFNPLFRDYPNALNLSSRPWPTVVEEYRRQTDVSEDARLIRSLTSPRQRVPLISSLETKILIDAGRPPFFYYVPLVYSRAWEILDFGGMEILTKTRMAKILNQLQTQAPAYVFVEKKLFLGLLPAPYYVHYQTLTVLMRYLSGHYTPAAQGKYLLALKIKAL